MEYVKYNVYEAPKTRTEAGTFIREFNHLEHAERFVNNSNKRGYNFFIKGVTAEGKGVTFI